MGWVGFGHSVDGLGLVTQLMGWVGFGHSVDGSGRVTENGPTDNSGSNAVRQKISMSIVQSIIYGLQQ